MSEALAPSTIRLEHELKIFPRFFDGIVSGNKTFELRKNDRGYAVGDLLILKEWDPHAGIYTGRIAHVVVTYMLEDTAWLQPEMACMAIRLQRAYTLNDADLRQVEE